MSGKESGEEKRTQWGKEAGPEKSPAEKLYGDQAKPAEDDAKERDLWSGRLSWKAYSLQYVGLAALAIVFLISLFWWRNSDWIRWIIWLEVVVWVAL